MSKFPAGMAALGLSLLLLAMVPTGTAEARGRHFRLGFGPFGVMRSFAVAIGGRHYRYGRRGHALRYASADATGSSRSNATRGADFVLKPVARVQAIAGAALVGWHGGRGAKGWWQHGDGSYGWVGPLFWPLAYYDIYDYALWGDGMGFWGYGYRDLYAAIFTPYDDDELARYVSPPPGRAFRRFPSLARICGDDASEVAGLPIEQISQLTGLNDEQRAKLDELRDTSLEAARTIRAACPAEAAPAPSGRLAAMQQRLEAMKAAIARLRTPFEEFYGSLDDGEKAELATLNNQRAPVAPKVPAAQSCTVPETLPWPTDEIEAKLHLSDPQREAFGALSRVNELARNTLNFNCQPEDQLAPPDRLATADTRLDAMLDAIKRVRPALDDFLATLSDAQKAQFETIGAKRTS